MADVFVEKFGEMSVFFSPPPFSGYMLKPATLLALNLTGLLNVCDSLNKSASVILSQSWSVLPTCDMEKLL